jgi:hypothetical protein
MLYYITNFSRTSVFLLYILIKITPMIIAGASINAITATMCPLKVYFCISKATAAKVTALTDPYAAIAPEFQLNFRLRIKKQ